jgi:hypothetical protein
VVCTAPLSLHRIIRLKSLVDVTKLLLTREDPGVERGLPLEVTALQWLQESVESELTGHLEPAIIELVYTTELLSSR